MGEKEKRKIFFALIGIAFLCRLLFAYFFPPIPAHNNLGDTLFYYNTSVSLTQGRGYVIDDKPTAYFPPGYSLFLSAFFTLFSPSYDLAQFLNILLGIISCILTYGITRKVFGEKTALISLGIMAISPTPLIWSGVVLSENLFLPLLLGIIWLWIDGISCREFSRIYIGKLALSGILLGIASLVRGQALLLPGVFFLWFLWNKKSFSSALSSALIISLLMISAVLPWTVRNKKVLGNYVLVSTNSGVNLLIGNHPGATGWYHNPEGGFPGDNEVERNHLSRQRALSYISSEPFDFLKLIPKKIFFLWCCDSVFTFRYDILTKLSQTMGYFLLSAALIVYYLLFFLTGAKFKIIQESSPQTVILFLLIFLYLSSFHAIFFGGPRYNYPFYPLLVILASVSIHTRVGKKRQIHPAS